MDKGKKKQLTEENTKAASQRVNVMVKAKARQQAALHMMVTGLWVSLMAAAKNKHQVAWSTQESSLMAYIMGMAK